MADWAATLRGSRSAPGSRRPSADDGPRPSAAVHRREMDEMIAQVEERDRALEAKEQQLSRLTAQLDELSEPTGDLPAHPAPLSPGPPVLEELSQRVAQVEQEAELRTVEGDALRAELAEAQRELAEEEQAATARTSRVAALSEETDGQRVLIQHLENAARASVTRAAFTRERDECESATRALIASERTSEAMSARLAGAEGTLGHLRQETDHLLERVGKLRAELSTSSAERHEAENRNEELASQHLAELDTLRAELRDANKKHESEELRDMAPSQRVDGSLAPAASNPRPA